MKPILLVGESNPYGSNPKWALYPDPVGCSGWRLCHVILGMTEDVYFETFDRINLCAARWYLPKAREGVARIAPEYSRIVLLGVKVAHAFGYAFAPFTESIEAGRRLLLWPHPSGLNRLWTRDAIGRARAQFAEWSAR